MRVFVAIDMPEEARDALEAVQEQVPVGRLMLAETVHLTLAFLGEQPDEVVIAVDEALRGLRAAAFKVRLHGLGTFGARNPAILWAGVRPEPALGELRNSVRRAVRLAGPDLPRERFRPHVTLARFAPRLKAEELERLRVFLSRFGDVALPDISVEHITLFRSHLLKDGAWHEPLAEYALRH